MTGEVWQRLPDFPPEGTEITGIVAGGPGLVAVGRVSSDGDCNHGDGRIWTSGDGRVWDAVDVDLSNVDLDDVVNAGGTLYAFGTEVSRECLIERHFTLRSADGVDWQRSQIPRGGDDYFSHFAAAGDTLIAFGEAYDDEGYSLGSVWTSADGVNWTLRPDSPDSSFVLEGAVALGDTVVLFDYAAHPVWISTDRAVSWRTADFGPQYNPYPAHVAVSNGRFVAVGSACCTTPDESAGFAITSTDGNDWRESEPFGFREVPHGIVGLPDGFVTIGRESLLSRDGLTWTVGPDLPGYESVLDRPPAGAFTTDAVVVTNGRRAWTAAISRLTAAGSGEAPELADRPQIGVPYPTRIFLHCGWPDTHFDLRPWLPDPPIDDANPPRGLDEFDRGTFTLVSEDVLVYQSRRGRTITLRPTDEPQLSGPCA